MDGKIIDRAIAKFRSLPRITQVDLELKAVLQQEKLTGKKYDIKNIDRYCLDKHSVKYLRHVYFEEYERQIHRLPIDSYLELHAKFTDAVCEIYPWLTLQATGYHRIKLRRAFEAKKHPLDHLLNNILVNCGVHKPIYEWRWWGTPDLFRDRPRASEEANIKVLTEIKRSQRELCSTSSSEYVRGCKDWLDEKLPKLRGLIEAEALVQ